MKVMKAFFLVLLLILSTSALGLKDANVYSISALFIINSNNTVYESINYTFSSALNKTIFAISKEFSDLYITDGNNELNYSLIENEKNTLVNVTLNNSVKLNIKYTAINEIFQKENVYLFYTNFDFKELISKADVRFILPQGYSIFKEEYSPKDALILSDGNRIILTWTKGNYKSITYSVSYYSLINNVNITNNQTINQTSQEDISQVIEIFNFIKNNIRKIVIFVLGLPIFALFLIIAASLFIIKKLKKSTKEMLLKGFMEDEQKAIIYLQKNKVVWQNKLRKDLNLSRVKTTRIIKKLEEKGLIKKEDFGKTNKIFWKK